jgi:hypothetical protein
MMLIRLAEEKSVAFKSNYSHLHAWKEELVPCCLAVKGIIRYVCHPIYRYIYIYIYKFIDTSVNLVVPHVVGIFNGVYRILITHTV